MFDGHGFGFGGAFMWIFWIALIAVVIWVVKAASGAGAADRERRKSPLEILQERFARGEIDEEDFKKKRDLLEP